MARVLFTWELGGGSGHLVNLQPLVRGLQSRGHQVFVALKDLSQAAQVFQGTAVSYLQAPYKSGEPATPIGVPRTFAHILYNVGFGDAAELEVMVNAWRNVIDWIGPEAIVFDHSPTALLAARGGKARRVVLGNSFSSPADVCPFPDLRPWLPAAAEELFAAEAVILENMNHVLRRLGQQPLERPAQLYGEVDDVFLTTLEEFDHYPNRADPRYRGPWVPAGGEAPHWPAGKGKKIVAYLKPCPVLPDLLSLLAQSNCPTVVHVEAMPADLPRRFAAANLCFEDRRLDLKRAAAECDAAILNGTHGSTLLMHLSGKPVLQLPIYLEQEVNARATVRLARGEWPPCGGARD